jgi:hypothetical protein
VKRFGASLASLAIVAVALLMSRGASALPGTFLIDQIFSNADGTVQFIVVRDSGSHDCDAGEQHWLGQRLVAGGPAGPVVYLFPGDLPTCHTSGRRILIATQEFADLGLVTPDFVIPNGFLQMPSGTVSLDDVGSLSYGALPGDGVTALDGNANPVPNAATNLAGQTASVVALPSLDLTQHGLTGSWFEPATNGQGIEVEVYPGVGGATSALYQVSWFTFDTASGGADHQRWYTAGGATTATSDHVELTIYRNTGGNFDAPPTTASEVVGSATLAFDTCASGRLDYAFTGGPSGSIPLTRLTQNVTCSTTAARATDPDFAWSGNWYDPATAGQGVTIEINAPSKVAFVAWYTYAPNGASAGTAGQRWYTAQGTFNAGDRSIPLQIYETTGGAFDTPSATAAPTSVQVGTATLTFQACGEASLAFAFSGGSNSGRSATIQLARVGPIPAGCTAAPAATAP